MASQSTAAAPIAMRTASQAVFQYVGRTALTVVGGVTGVRYRFDAPGARVIVDRRDRTSLAAVPVLRDVG